LVDGFVISISKSSEFEGSLSEIVEVISVAKILNRDIFDLASAVATRQAATVSDVLKLAVPDRSVAVEKKWLEDFKPVIRTQRGSSKRTSQIVRPVTNDQGPEWALSICKMVNELLATGGSAIIVLPDFRDHNALMEQLLASTASELVIDYSTSLPKSKRYSSFLKCISKPQGIVVGARSAIYAPVNNLTKIVIWDDGDTSHQDQTSPYSHTREIAMMRQAVEKCDIHVFSHSRSTEMARLLAIKYFTDTSEPFAIPKVANSESEIRVDSLAWTTIRSALKTGSVLVQVASKGSSSSAFCSMCNRRAMCKNCHGPIWIDSRNMARCRWCNSGNLDHRCQDCGSNKMRLGVAGTTRTAAEFGKAFPGSRIIESTGESPILHVPPNSLVIATPGAEPITRGGYSAVVILDAQKALAKDSLRATEDAIRTWCNAIALMSSDGRAVLVGLSGTLATKVSLWAIDEISRHELDSRMELRFPPAIRLASIGAEHNLIQAVIEDLGKIDGVEILGPISITDKGSEIESRVLLKYEYSVGAKLAETLKTQSLKLSAGQHRFSAKSGRAIRPIRIKMDDHEVI
jgi:primosomal protein N' (replication factor Y)